MNNPRFVHVPSAFTYQRIRAKERARREAVSQKAREIASEPGQFFSKKYWNLGIIRSNGHEMCLMLEPALRHYEEHGEIRDPELLIRHYISYRDRMVFIQRFMDRFNQLINEAEDRIERSE